MKTVHTFTYFATLHIPTSPLLLLSLSLLSSKFLCIVMSDTRPLLAPPKTKRSQIKSARKRR
eukprot:COSAG05_NODE_771_length_7443_cov_8.561138_2_plen_62_part_00